MSSHGLLLGGRYRLKSQIAAGGVGEVWRAGDLVLGRPVAVKVLREGYASHPQTLARFHAEARHAGSLTHPGIAQVYDYGEAGAAGAPYMVLELAEGPSLAAVLDGGPLDPAAVMDVVAQVAAALAAAHAVSLIHRDVKPANLLMSPDGLVKITDFGIAHVAGSAPITHVGTLEGTPAYLAPERAAGGPATPASDLPAVLAAAALAALTGWLVASTAGAQARRPAPASPPASTRGPAVVNFGDAALVGKPVGTVLRQLAGLGLRSRVIRSTSGSQPPGTVISLQPSGQVTEGSVITVTIAVAPPGHRHHHHQGNDHHQAPGGGQGGD
jgi:hypothetical protein